MGEDPETLFNNDAPEASNGIPTETITSEKNVFTGLIRATDEEHEMFYNHQARVYTMEKIPP